MVTDNLTPPRRPWGTYALGSLWAVIGTSALLMLAKSVQNSSEFGRLQPWILLLNLVGVIGLTVLIARKIWQLVRDYRAIESAASAAAKKRLRGLEAALRASTAKTAAPKKTSIRRRKL